MNRNNLHCEATHGLPLQLRVDGSFKLNIQMQFSLIRFVVSQRYDRKEKEITLPQG